MPNELKNCPFCGCSNAIQKDFEFYGRDEQYSRHFVSCICGARGPSAENQKKAIDKWNARQPEQRVEVQWPTQDQLDKIFLESCGDECVEIAINKTVVLCKQSYEEAVRK